MAALPIDEDGCFAGYASLFGTLDAGGDMVMPGAFAESLARRGGRIRLLFQHDPKEPVGTWERLTEDGRGLWAEGRLVPGVPRADALRRLIARRAIDGLSIGFRTVRATRARGGHRRLWQVDLWEISIVSFPMVEGARIVPDAGGAGQPARLRRSLDAAITLLRN